jgi:uncharacterized protein (DUF1800 family)
MNRAKRCLRQGVRVLGAGAKGTVTAALCVLLVAPQAVEAAELAAGSVGGAAAVPEKSHAAKLTQQEKVLQALNRFTFGPRPGDEAAVSRLGLDKWFELQLHPERIDDAAFEQEMQNYPAMQLTETERMERFPSPQMIRQMAAKGAALPSDPVERAVYLDAEATYEAQRKKQERAAVAAAPQVGMNGAPGDRGATPQVSEARPGAPGFVASPTQDGETVIVKGASGTKGKLLKHQVPVMPVANAQVEAVLAMAPEERFGALVAMSPAESVGFRDALRPAERARLIAGLTPQQSEAVEAMQAPVRVVDTETMETRLLRDIDSQRQLQAVMTDFWLNHFNVYARKNQNEPYYLAAYQRDSILPHALGKFEDLLVATAESPAMQMYLDNWQSVGPNSVAAQRAAMVESRNPNKKLAKKMPEGINENYGRELMELHTLGVNGGYTQKDVIEVAKCFTGWTIERPYGANPNGQRRLVGGPGVGQGGTAMGAGGGRFQKPARLQALGFQALQGNGAAMQSAEPGAFVFNPNRHEPGSKLVLGHVIPEGGMKEGLEVLHILATSPATAHHISEQLAERFVSDTPPPALVNRMAKTFLKSDGDMKSVLTTMFRSPEFWSPQVYRAKVKTPIEFLVSAVRASGTTVNNPLPLVNAMDRLGMPLYGMQTPNGYSWTADAWVSSNALIARMNFALVLSGGRVPGTVVNWPALLGSAGDETATVASAPTPATEAKLEMVLLGEPAALRTRDTVLAQFNNPTAQTQAEESFNAAPVKGEQGGLMRASFGRKGGGRAGGFQAGGPETPLATMAGLLLGSPDFQRR